MWLSLRPRQTLWASLGKLIFGEGVFAVALLVFPEEMWCDFQCVAHLFFWLIFNMDSSYGWEWWETLLFLHIRFTSPNHFFVFLSALSLSGSRGGVHIRTKVASSSRGPMWAIEGVVPCSTVPRQCSQGYSGTSPYCQNMFNVWSVLGL